MVFSIQRRYGLVPVWARGKAPQAAPKKKQQRKSARAQPEWNAYLTDASRYKLPAKEQERRKREFSNCGPRRAIAQAASPSWHTRKRRPAGAKAASPAAATPERERGARAEPSSAASTVPEDVFDLLADGDAPPTAGGSDNDDDDDDEAGEPQDECPRTAPENVIVTWEPA